MSRSKGVSWLVDMLVYTLKVTGTCVVQEVVSKEG